MIRIRFAVAFLVIAWIHGLIADAEEPAIRLPEDGWWIRYGSTTKHEFNGRVRESTCKLTHSLVGTVMEDGETCRWVELNSVCTLGEKEHIVIWKFLVPEKDLLQGDQPLDTLKRAWMKVNELDVRPVEVGQGIFRGNQLMIFPGMWKNAERVEKERVVDYQQGRLTIPEAKTRKVTAPVRTVNRPVLRKSEDEKFVSEYTAWFDRTTSPAFAAAKIQRKRYANDVLQGTTEDDLIVEDYGTGAKSQLPDNN